MRTPRQGGPRPTASKREDIEAKEAEISDREVY
jgi:hypothetical protein